MLNRIYRLLLPDERRKVLVMAVSVFMSALLDFAGLAALLPALYYLLDEGGQKDAAIFFSLMAVSVILLKCVLITYLTRYQNRCLLSFYKRLSFSLFSSYFGRGLLFIKEQGCNKLRYEITGMCYIFCFSLLAPLCRMVGDVLLIVLVTSALLCWKGTTVMILYASFVPFMCIYFFSLRKKIRMCGREDMDVKREQARMVNDALRGYIELEINGAFPALQRSFLEGMGKISDIRMKMDTLLRLPQLLSELSVVVGLALLVAFGGGDLKMVVGVFSVAAFRLLPALRTILAGWTQIQNSICTLDVIEEGLKEYGEDTEQETTEIAFEKEISIEGLTYGYPGHEPIFDNLNCHIEKGEYIGICGTSGAGKTTLFNLLTGLIQPDCGMIKIDGVSLTEAMRASWMKKISYVPQDVFIFNGTVAENIALGSKCIEKNRVQEILVKVCLDKWVNSLPEGVDSKLNENGGNLSGGQRQRIGIARALYKEAELILLDEATSALDNATEKEINRLICELRKIDKGLTILSVAHRESTLSYCDRVIVIGNDDE